MFGFVQLPASHSSGSGSSIVFCGSIGSFGPSQSASSPSRRPTRSSSAPFRGLSTVDTNPAFTIRLCLNGNHLHKAFKVNTRNQTLHFVLLFWTFTLLEGYKNKSITKKQAIGQTGQNVCFQQAEKDSFWPFVACCFHMSKSSTRELHLTKIQTLEPRRNSHRKWIK